MSTVEDRVARDTKRHRLKKARSVHTSALFGMFWSLGNRSCNGAFKWTHVTYAKHSFRCTGDGNFPWIHCFQLIRISCPECTMIILTCEHRVKNRNFTFIVQLGVFFFMNLPLIKLSSFLSVGQFPPQFSSYAYTSVTFFTHLGSQI